MLWSIWRHNSISTELCPACGYTGQNGKVRLKAVSRGSNAAVSEYGGFDYIEVKNNGR